LIEICCCFFCQAEDGIRDRNVTGVQTCALPISGTGARRFAVEGCPPGRPPRPARVRPLPFRRPRAGRGGWPGGAGQAVWVSWKRSEERRVGKEGRARWWATVGR